MTVHELSIMVLGFGFLEVAIVSTSLSRLFCFWIMSEEIVLSPGGPHGLDRSLDSFRLFCSPELSTAQFIIYSLDSRSRPHSVLSPFSLGLKCSTLETVLDVLESRPSTYWEIGLRTLKDDHDFRLATNAIRVLL
ncbi:hypothetical protein FRC03_008735 [Tulasnella sp. 419]|nr:hypothetical protein FRC03_008735 [Tulasnella sp. 419]